ncbi:MAG: plasmid recombination protein [Prevotella sp.]|nr:plasmid recombination protein [Prevotella sp.]
MASAKQVMDFRPSKGITTAQSNEHQRRWTENGWQSAVAQGNYDRSRERLNFEIRNGKVCPVDKSRSIPERMSEILRDRGIKDPNEGLEEPRFRTVANFIFGGSRERMTELAFGDQKVDLTHGADNSHLHRCKDIEDWAKDVYRFVADKYGEENIVAFIAHLDETNPHVHCTLLPIKDGRFAYKQIFAGKDKYEFSARMKALHSEFAEVNQRWGMERGTSVSETGARHRTTEEYRRQLSEQCTTIEQTITAHQRTLVSLQSDIRLAERRVKGLTSMVGNLLQEKAEKEAALAELHRQILAGHDNPDALRQQVNQLEKELSSIRTKLDDKQEKLSEADRKLDALREEMTAIQERTEELRQEAYKYSGTIQKGADILLKNALLENMVSEFSERAAQLSDEGKNVFDGSLLQAFAENGTEVMYCATLLFLGYVDDATTFAEGHGGGGSSSDLKWGRDDDEDERAWARRCMMKAARMMCPSSGKKKKR